MDIRGGKGYQNFTLEVINVNDAPKWVTIPTDTEIPEGNLFIFDVNATDIDVGDILTFNLSSQPKTNITIDSKTGLIEWRVRFEFMNESQYTLEVTLSVTDGNVTIWANFKITIIMNPRPTVKLISPANNSRVSGRDMELKWMGFDDNNDALTFVLYISKDRSAISGLLTSHRIINNTNLTSYLTNDLDVGGIYYWTVVPFDSFRPGECPDGYFKFEVNIPPTISVIQLQKATVGSKFKLELIVQDPNYGDIRNLNYSLESAPDGMSINQSTGVLTWTPKDTHVGNHNVTVAVSDGIDKVNITFQIEISEKATMTGLYNFIIISSAGFIILLVAIGSFIGGTEVGKYKFFSVIVVPFYNRLHPNRVTDNFIRGKIIGYIAAKPGENYNKIKFALKLVNGTFTYHAKILEKEGLITIVRDGIHTRFYPKGTYTQTSKAPPLKIIQEELIDMIRHEPGITQHEIIDLSGLDQKVISYNLLQLKRNDLIRVEQNGRENKYYVNETETDYSQPQDQDQSSDHSQHMSSGYDQGTYMTADSEYEPKKM
jgi:DNA-binding MarR family transcriptional regulator